MGWFFDDSLEITKAHRHPLTSALIGRPYTWSNSRWFLNILLKEKLFLRDWTVCEASRRCNDWATLPVEFIPTVYYRWETWPIIIVTKLVLIIAPSIGKDFWLLICRRLTPALGWFYFHRIVLSWPVKSPGSTTLESFLFMGWHRSVGSWLHSPNPPCSLASMSFLETCFNLI